MGGLRRLCKMYGAMKIQGVMWVWDYVKDEPVKKSEMTHEQWCASERAKYAALGCDSDRREKPGGDEGAEDL